MKRKPLFVILLILLISMIFIWIFTSKIKHDKNEVNRTIIMDKNGNKIDPIQKVTGNLGK
ncbi:hypothetical protein IGJ19_002581 [Enterococcus sp. DIV1368b]|uniref:Uncharacterized protein n=1 Tax=Enterococcus mundtii TaxID=53346 RepID=A0A1I4PLL5_ENTMU|nr:MULTISPECIES: hypothetical protein [Enterococcus]MZU11695.1 hypothetical protein [Bifidobacterium longum]GEN19210.1 hypothetical protein LAC02_24910 [Ligilactobacillus acidipiscis]AUB53727.1 hypothetical protein EM4838_12245 [Enterococcus mundtii]MDB7088610.1 hypothetical protein [Enterococcus mundtii]MZZ59736.1 hypothetical protein [Enterococcus mundtii]